MITIFAEKPDVGNKIAAALDRITLSSGKTVSFGSLKTYEKEVKSQGSKDGYFRISLKGEEAFVTWGFGHLCELKQAKDYNPAYKNWRNLPAPFIPDSYEIKPRSIPEEKDKYGYNDKIKRQLKLISELFAKSRMIINATDFDREGEVIFSYVYEITKAAAPVQRACFSSQTQTGICDGFSKDLKSGKDMRNIESAGRMRGIADWVVGANLTVSTTLWNSGTSVYSVGRVQTPTLRMVVDREKAICGFTSIKYYVIEALFQTEKNESFKAKYYKDKIETKKEAESILKKLQEIGIISNVDRKRVNKAPPSLFSLSSLQMECNSRFGFTLKQTLDLVQKLYDNGYVTYPRSDSSYLTEDMEPVVNKVLDRLLAKISEYAKWIDGKPRRYVKSRYFNNAKVESHFAIIPTENVPKTLSDDESKVYDLIAKSVIQMLYSDALIQQSKIYIDVNGEMFTAQETRIIEKGFLEVDNTVKETLLPSLSIKDLLSGKYQILEKDSEPPKRYTEKTLLAAMISCGKELDDKEMKKVLDNPSVSGIGTVATRDAIIETLIQREYIARKGKTLIATEKGINLIDRLLISDVKSPEMTAKWEKRLNLIANGKEDPQIFLKDIENSVRDWCLIFSKEKRPLSSSDGKSTDTLPYKCPLCGKPMVKKTWGVGCSGYRDGCKFSIGQTISKKKLSDKQMEKLLKTGQTDKISGFTSKSGKKYDATLALKDGKLTFLFEK